MIHMPAAGVQHPGDHAIPLLSVCQQSLAGQRRVPEFSRQIDDIFGQSLFVGRTTGHLALRGSVLTRRAAGPTFRNPKGLPQLVDALSPLDVCKQTPGRCPAMHACMHESGAMGGRKGSETSRHCFAKSVGQRCSPGSLPQDHLVQRQIRYRTPQRLAPSAGKTISQIVFWPGSNLKLLQPFELIPAHPALNLLLAPSIIALNRHTDLPHSLRNRFSLALQPFHPPQLQHDVLRLLSLPSHSLVLGPFENRTIISLWGTTSVGAFHKDAGNDDSGCGVMK